MTTETSGFYQTTGITTTTFPYAPNAVHFPGGTSILKENHETYTYPVNDWIWFDSIEDAYSSQGKTPPKEEEPKKQKRPN